VDAFESAGPQVALAPDGPLARAALAVAQVFKLAVRGSGGRGYWVALQVAQPSSPSGQRAHRHESPRELGAGNSDSTWHAQCLGDPAGVPRHPALCQWGQSQFRTILKARANLVEIGSQAIFPASGRREVARHVPS
jgi:hypothetical protein